MRSCVWIHRETDEPPHSEKRALQTCFVCQIMLTHIFTHIIWSNVFQYTNYTFIQVFNLCAQFIRLYLKLQLRHNVVALINVSCCFFIIVFLCRIKMVTMSSHMVDVLTVTSEDSPDRAGATLHCLHILQRYYNGCPQMPECGNVPLVLT